jgi:hypothetical protein
LIDLAEDEVVDGLGSLLAKGLIRRVYNGEHDWFLALPDLSRPS